VQFTRSSKFTPVRVSDSAAHAWLWTQAPCCWHGNVSLKFREILFDELQPATTLKHWDVLATWTRQIACRRRVPPLIVSQTDSGQYYIHDGNHRWEAIRICYRKQLRRLWLRVAILEPHDGFSFEYRRFGNYGTYRLINQGYRICNLVDDSTCSAQLLQNAFSLRSINSTECDADMAQR
jgi:hypothetical protein